MTTKAATKADKVRRKRGRPPKQGYREPNGRLSRAQEPPHKLAIEARAKMLGISVIEAIDPDGATYLGYLHINRKRWENQNPRPELPPVNSISTTQYDAAQKYIELRHNFLKSKSAPEVYYEAGPPSDLSPEERDEAHAAWAASIEERYHDARKVIQKCQDENKQENVWAAIDLIFIRDVHLPHMVGATRLVCNYLSRHFRT